MSHYDDDPPRHRKSHRHDRPRYEEEEVYESRNSRGGVRQNALVRRPHDDSDSVEEVEREFPPGGGYRSKQRHGRRTRSADYDDDYYDPRRRRGGHIFPMTKTFYVH